jgi:hypothetical protein
LNQKWRSLTRSQTVAFVLTCISIIGGLAAWRFPDFWKSKALDFQVLAWLVYLDHCEIEDP